MSKSFTADNCEVWIHNWKRKNLIGNVVAKSYLDTWPELEKVNVIVNHSSVTIEDFPLEIRPRVKIWKNDLRHDLSKGPINSDINQAYIQTFLSGKEYCVFAHDSYFVKPGWQDCIKNTDYDLWSAPQGDGFHVQTLNGLKTFGFWDQRYNSIAQWHEIDYLCRALRTSHVLNKGKCSLIDVHGLWPFELPFVKDNHHLYYNSVGLENYVIRFPKDQVVQIGDNANAKFKAKGEQWHRQKWGRMFDEQPHGSGTLYNIMNGPVQPEIDFYPWLDLDNLTIDRTGY